MAFIGNTNTTQAFTPAVDFFSGNASTTAFTLSRPVASVAQVQAVVNNVAQNPSDAFTVSGNTITFTSAPSSGTNNIYVYYTSPITQVIAPGQGTVAPTQVDASYALWNKSDSTINYTAGNVGIGTSSPTGTLHIASSAPTIFIQDTNGATTAATGYIDFIDSSASRIGYIGYASTLNSDLDINVTQNANIDFLTNNTRQMSLTSEGLLRFNSGYGSVATAYGCRAWVNFNGTGTVAIRGSGNVSSITDNGTGDYTVNFTTAMTDVNYCSLVTGGNQTGVDITGYANIRDPATQKLVGSVRVQIVISTSTPYDSNNVNVAIFR
jgi:hypothetical protein